MGKLTQEEKRFIRAWRDLNSGWIRMRKRDGSFMGVERKDFDFDAATYPPKTVRARENDEKA